MSTLELFFIAVGLSMDAFAAAVCKGLSAPNAGRRERLMAGAYFGGFQALMPLLGYWLGERFTYIITAYDHWIAFVLLVILGVRMLIEAAEDLRCPQEAEVQDASFTSAALLPMAVATSIDALAVGITFAFLQVHIVQAVTLIGLTTFLFSAIGVRLGQRVGGHCRFGAELLGGVTLILIGCRILLSHLGVI